MTFDAIVGDASGRGVRSAVVAGLSGPRKSVPCRWLYDDAAAPLRRDHPARRLLSNPRGTGYPSRRARDIAGFCGEKALLLEYGAGAGIKTEILLDALRDPRLYVPIDIAADMLGQTAARIAGRFRDLDVFPVLADFTGDFDLPSALPRGRRVAFFPGSTIGNLNRREAVALLSRMRRHVQGSGAAVIGIDLKKDLRTLLDAYDDGEGVTVAFNLNLLARINRELDGAFPLDRFFHEARWNKTELAVEMHLVSLDARKILAAGQTFAFTAGKSIHTESSRKYDLSSFAALAGAAGWRLSHSWRDEAGRFAVLGLDSLA